MINRLLKRLIADYICWIVATIVLLYFSHPLIAGIVGSTGIMYLSWATNKYSWIMNISKEIEEGRDG